MSQLPEKNADAVFKINTSSGTGSGFYLRNKNILVTNFHVVQGHRTVAVEDQGKERYLANVVFVNPTTDLAFLQPVRNLNIHPRVFDSFASVRERERVYVLGFPFGMPYTETEGIVSSPRQLMGGRYYIQTDAAVNPGNSGGPVVNANGQLVGITTSKFTDADNVGFAIPVNDLQEDLESFNFNRGMTYAVKCSSCKNLIFTKTEYCNNCGNSIDSSVFDQIAPNEPGKFIEQALSITGINPVLARGGEDYWNFYYGSSMITIYFHDREYLYALSPINELPTSNLEKLLKYILSAPLPAFKLGIFDNKIYIFYRIHMSDMFSAFAEDVRKALSLFPLKADEMSHFFQKHFNCPMTNYSKPQKLKDSPEDLGQQAINYGSQAEGLKKKGKLAEALEVYKKQEAIYKQLESEKHQLAQNYAKQALIFRDLGQFPQALGLYQKERQIYESLGMHKELAGCYGDLTKLCLRWGNLKEALNFQRNEENIYKKLNDRSGLASSWWRKGIIYGQAKDYQTLIKCWQYSIQLYKSIGISTQNHEAELQKIVVKHKAP
ncbi:MAG: trypsin-like peptidase domain-containing protein [Candidatus Aminicenantes bacterium]|jgi:serine protease Do